MNHAKPSSKYLTQLRKRYAKATKKQRTAILNELVATSNYHRKHASALLAGKRQWRTGAHPIRRPRHVFYTAEDQRAVFWLLELFDDIGSKRLRAAMNNELVTLRRKGHLQVSRQCYRHLQHVSPSTMDRWCRAAQRPQSKTRGGTKPGTLLKRQIPIRTFAEWNDKRVGFGEIDLVQHDGGTNKGDFACTLDFTDVATGWTEPAATPNKAQVHVFAALQKIRARLPFPLLGIDSDNGSEFINNELYRYCVQEELTFTRGRVGRKNDNPFVEQKNWSAIRRSVGYGRYDTPNQLQCLNAFYEVHRLYLNHFLPVTKLVVTQRQGRRLKKKYDALQTPYQRVLDAPELSAKAKAKLRREHTRLDLVALKREWNKRLNVLKPTPQW